MNADESMLVTLFGIVKEVKPVQPLNAEDPIPVTLFGIVIEVKPLQPLNAEEGILVPPLITTVCRQFLGIHEIAIVGMVA